MSDYAAAVKAALATNDPRMCRCWPHGPFDPCLCDGRYTDGTPGCCPGREIGCLCDITWDCEHDADQRAEGQVFWLNLKKEAGL